MILAYTEIWNKFQHGYTEGQIVNPDGHILMMYQIQISEIENDTDIVKIYHIGEYTFAIKYTYYLRLLHKLKKTPSVKIKTTRIRVPNYQKFNVLLYSYFKHQFNLYKFIP